MRDRSSGLSAEAVYALPPNARPYGQRGAYPKPPRRTNSDGRNLCRWCEHPLANKYRWWCGSDCVAEFMRRAHWPTMAEFIAKRDRVCQLCNGGRYDITADQLYFGGELGALFDGQPWVFWHLSSRNGGPDHRPRACHLKVTWAVDHIIAVRDGGTDDPRNLRLLCGRCHGEVTAAQHRRWALERRQVAATASPQGRLEL